MSALLLLRVGVLSKVPAVLTGCILVLLVIGMIAFSAHSIYLEMGNVASGGSHDDHSARHADELPMWKEILDPASGANYWCVTEVQVFFHLCCYASLTRTHLCHL